MLWTGSCGIKDTFWNNVLMYFLLINLRHLCIIQLIPLKPQNYISETLTHWGRVTHICVSDLTSIGSDNGLSPGRRQAIIRTNAGILLIRPLETNFSQFLVEILIFSFKKMRLKVSSAKRRPFCLGLNEFMNGCMPVCLGRRVQPNNISPNKCFFESNVVLSVIWIEFGATWNYPLLLWTYHAPKYTYTPPLLMNWYHHMQNGVGTERRLHIQYMYHNECPFFYKWTWSTTF